MERPSGTNSKWITPSKFHHTNSIILCSNFPCLTTGSGKLLGLSTLPQSEFRKKRAIYIAYYNSFNVSVTNPLIEYLPTHVGPPLRLCLSQIMGYHSIPSVDLRDLTVSKFSIRGAIKAPNWLDNLHVFVWGLASTVWRTTSGPTVTGIPHCY